MANGESCKHCGEYETLHDLEPKNTCGEFESEFTHKAGCPVYGCDGDCAETIRKQVWEAEVLANRAANTWFLHKGQVYFLDLGS